MNAIVIPDEAVSLSLPDDMAFDEWTALGKSLIHKHRNLQWLIGDWCLHGKRYGEQLTLALPDITDDPQAMRKVAEVAEAFPPHMRDSGLSFAHHSHVAGLPKETALDMLQKARRENWTAKRLRIEAMPEKVAAGLLVIMTDDDAEHSALVELARAWNRAPVNVREDFIEMATEADMGDIDV